MLIKSACQILKTTARKVVPDQICQEKNLLAGMLFAVVRFITRVRIRNVIL